jgi:hypothetical protein
MLLLVPDITRVAAANTHKHVRVASRWGSTPTPIPPGEGFALVKDKTHICVMPPRTHPSTVFKSASARDILDRKNLRGPAETRHKVVGAGGWSKQRMRTSRGDQGLA